MGSRSTRYDTLVRPILGDLYRFARRLTGDRVAAEDLLQQSLVKGLQALPDLREMQAFKAWQSRVLYRTWLDAQRKMTEEPMTSEEIQDASGRGGPELVLLNREVGDQIATALDSLPEDQRHAVWLVDGQGHTFAEAANVLGIPEGTAASRVARGRRALRALLEQLAQEQGVGR